MAWMPASFSPRKAARYEAPPWRTWYGWQSWWPSWSKTALNLALKTLASLSQSGLPSGRPRFSLARPMPRATDIESDSATPSSQPK
eukprot:9042781-Pyramimonas_sp.AAC.1